MPREDAYKVPIDVQFPRVASTARVNCGELQLRAASEINALTTALTIWRAVRGHGTAL